jgi:hypothetical protein
MDESDPRLGIALGFARAKAEAWRFCAICGASRESEGRRLAHDHDHKSGRWRGYLCGLCNTGLGAFRDNPSILLRAIQYLEFHHPELTHHASSAIIPWQMPTILFTSETAAKARCRQGGLKRAAYWRSLGWPNLKRAWIARDAYWARYREYVAEGRPPVQARELAKRQ